MTFLLAFLVHRHDCARRRSSAPSRQRRDQPPARRVRSAAAQDPASLRIAAEYRQLVIESGRYDRSIKLFERLAKDPRGGANRYLNLALANVDKVPVSGSVRRALLGRDALDALTRAIAIEPTDLAYLIRGLVNLYYDQFVFHRTDKGVADLETARALAAAHPAGAVRAADSGRARRRLLAAEPPRQGARRCGAKARRRFPTCTVSASGSRRATSRFPTSSSTRSMPASASTPRCANCFPISPRRVRRCHDARPAGLHHRHPDLQRAGPHRRRCSSGSSTPAIAMAWRSRSSSSTTTRPTGPARSPTSGRAPARARDSSRGQARARHRRPRRICHRAERRSSA